MTRHPGRTLLHVPWSGDAVGRRLWLGVRRTTLVSQLHLCGRWCAAFAVVDGIISAALRVLLDEQDWSWTGTAGIPARTDPLEDTDQGGC